ncbi:putative baseplate wedge subunit [Salmonella phage 38]|uniref:Putative baseplate wedge subunit n=1 Tax=Salmonella phage 38 TaxID=1654891 RepID=A0A0N7CEU8_9CAUD|nr:putative baseplate wedge subunit [Salmonella phage 38]AKJ73786.1 putative baseplate wedge subunit [Salmonella phage 38]
MKEYKDIDLKFGMHPVTKDVTKKTGVYAVLQSVRNIVMTTVGDWPTYPSIGAGLYTMLGENTNPTIQVDVKTKLKTRLLYLNRERRYNQLMCHCLTIIILWA